MFKKKKKHEEEPVELVESEQEMPAEMTADPEDWLGEGVPEGQLNVDLYETPQELVVVAPVAGVSPEKLDIRIKDNVLSIRGERKAAREVERDNYFLQETFWGSFSRELELPTPVNGEKAKVSHEDGVLTIRLPKIVQGSEVTLKIKNSRE